MGTEQNIKLLHICKHWRLGIAASLFLFLTACLGNRDKVPDIPVNYLESYPDTLKIGTLYGPISYFEYRDQAMGYDYSLAMQFGEDKDIPIKIIVSPSMRSMIEMLDSGLIDIIAYDIPVTSEYLEHVQPCGYEHLSSQVLVQKKGKEMVKDVTELVGKTVFVEPDSKYLRRLVNLNDEIGGGMEIKEVKSDTIVTLDLLSMVSSGEIDYAVVDSEIAAINKGYFRDLDFSVDISFPQRSSWAVAKVNKWLADSIDKWFEEEDHAKANKSLLRKYYEFSIRYPYLNSRDAQVADFSKNFSKGYISEYDSLFRKYSKEINMDWRLYAAICYAESKFNNDVESWAGAKGIMQVMPSSANAYNVSVDKLTIPEESVALATKILKSTDEFLSRYVPDRKERMKFIIAAYNSGIGHIKDAITITKAKGWNPEIWDGNVEEAIKLKSNPEVYNDKSICQFGAYKGTLTAEYVKDVMALYDKAQKNID